MKKNVENLREAARQLNAAADHQESEGTRGPAGAGKFNWQGLIKLLMQVVPEIIALFGNQPAPPAPQS